MNYDNIPAMDAKTEAERKLAAELRVFCAKMNIVESQMHKALRTIETARKTFVSMDAAPKTFGGMKLPVMPQEFNTVATELQQ